MTMHLVVHEPFQAYAKGDRITDPAEVERIQGSENARHVTRVISNDPPHLSTPEPESSPAPAAPAAPDQPV